MRLQHRLYGFIAITLNDLPLSKARSMDLSFSQTLLFYRWQKATECWPPLFKAYVNPGKQLMWNTFMSFLEQRSHSFRTFSGGNAKKKWRRGFSICKFHQSTYDNAIDTVVVRIRTLIPTYLQATKCRKQFRRVMRSIFACRKPFRCCNRYGIGYDYCVE